MECRSPRNGPCANCRPPSAYGRNPRRPGTITLLMGTGHRTLAFIVVAMSALAGCTPRAPSPAPQSFVPSPRDATQPVSVETPPATATNDPEGPETPLPEPPPTEAPDEQPPPVEPPQDTPAGALLYPFGQVQSPLTQNNAERLRALIAEKDRQNDVFGKIGASSTVSTHYLRCLATTSLASGPFAGLEPTRTFFLAGNAAGTDPYRRVSLCATSGWTASHALDGSPSPLTQELSAIMPRFAQVHYGTNDIGWNNPDRFADNMFRITDQMLGGGTIPWLSTILPNLSNDTSNAWVPRYNAIIHAIAQSRGVPLLDFYEASRPLPGWGMAADGLHPKAYYADGVARPCDFAAAGLDFGHNVRNLITLQLLDRLKRVLLDGEEAFDAPSQVLSGQGTREAPFLVPSLPFADVKDTRQSSSRVIDAYAGCDAAQDESGPEYFYRFSLSQNTTLRISVHSRAGVDVDVHLLGEDPVPEQCIARDHESLLRALSPGTYYLVLDTFVSQGTEDAGEFVVSILPEP